MELYNKDIKFFNGSIEEIENIETDYITRSGSEYLSVGKYIENNNGIKAKIIGREKEVPYGKGKKYFIVFDDNCLSLVSTTQLSNRNFKHPIVFAKGNNSNNKYKTIYKRYEQIKSRTSNKNDISFERYGARGIKCDFENFYDFYFYLSKLDNYDKLINDETKNKYEIDRIDNNSNYEIGNIRIVTKSENQMNKNSNRNYKIYNYSTGNIDFEGNQTESDNWFAEVYNFSNAHTNEAYKNKLRIGSLQGLTYVVLMDDEKFDFNNYGFFTRLSYDSKYSFLVNLGLDSKKIKEVIK